MSFLELEGLSKAYGASKVLCDVNLSLEQGEVLGLLGRNGAGKTTMLSIIAGLLRPDAGTVTLAGFDSWRSRSRFLERLGFVPQELSIYPTLSVATNLRFFAELRCVPRAQVAAEIERVGQRLLLTELLGRRAGQLSGGEQRRLHAAIGLLGRPSCVLLDEPTVGADAETRAQLIHEVQQLAAEGTTIIYTSHYTPELEQVSDRVAILDHGILRAVGSIDDVVSSVAGSYLELTFRDAVPASFGGGHDGRTVRLPSIDPARELVDVVRNLGSSADALLALEIIRPSLESAYLSLTGTRLEVGR